MWQILGRGTFLPPSPSLSSSEKRKKIILNRVKSKCFSCSFFACYYQIGEIWQVRLCTLCSMPLWVAEHVKSKLHKMIVYKTRIIKNGFLSFSVISFFFFSLAFFKIRFYKSSFLRMNFKVLLNSSYLQISTYPVLFIYKVLKHMTF